MYVTPNGRRWMAAAISVSRKKEALWLKHFGTAGRFSIRPPASFPWAQIPFCWPTLPVPAPRIGSWTWAPVPGILPGAAAEHAAPGFCRCHRVGACRLSVGTEEFYLQRLDARTRLISGDLRQHRTLVPAGGFDLTVSNPPYFPVGTGYDAAAGLQNARGDGTCTLDDLCCAAAWATGGADDSVWSFVLTGSPSCLWHWTGPVLRQSVCVRFITMPPVPPIWCWWKHGGAGSPA